MHLIDGAPCSAVPGRGKVLVVAPRHPCPPTRGDQARTWHLVKELSKRAEVTLICFGTGDVPVEGLKVTALRRSLPRSVWANLLHPAPLIPGQTRLHLDSAMAQAIAADTFSLEAGLMRRYEAALVRRADSASLVSEADRAAARGLADAVVPMGVDLDAFPYETP